MNYLLDFYARAATFHYVISVFLNVPFHFMSALGNYYLAGWQEILIVMKYCYMPHPYHPCHWLLVFALPPLCEIDIICLNPLPLCQWLWPFFKPRFLLVLPFIFFLNHDFPVHIHSLSVVRFYPLKLEFLPSLPN